MNSESVKFLNYSEIESCFKANDFSSVEKIFKNRVVICSVSDILFICEQFKKNNINTTIGILNDNHKKFINSGVYFPQIDKDNLLDNLFDIDENDVQLWEKACNKKISPRFSVSLLALRINSSSFWNEDTFEEMEHYYLNFESY